MTANGKILAIRIQDGNTGIWYNYDLGKGWNNPPTPPYITANANLYISLYVTSATTGKVTLKISSPSMSTYFRQSNLNVSPSQPAGIEGNYTMPNENIALNFTVTDVS